MKYFTYHCTMIIKEEHKLLRKQLSIMKEETIIASVKLLVNTKIVSKEDINDILESLQRVEFRFEIENKPPEGMMNFNNIDVK